MEWTTPLLPDVVPEIDANPACGFLREGRREIQGR